MTVERRIGEFKVNASGDLKWLNIQFWFHPWNFDCSVAPQWSIDQSWFGFFHFYLADSELALMELTTGKFCGGLRACYLLQVFFLHMSVSFREIFEKVSILTYCGVLNILAAAGVDQTNDPCSALRLLQAAFENRQRRRITGLVGDFRIFCQPFQIAQCIYFEPP